MADHDSALDLQNLIRLQELESSMALLRERVGRTPEQIERLDEQLEDAKRLVEGAEEAIAGAGKVRRQLEADVESLREKLSHYQEQLMLVKTNTEYQAMLHEIEFVKKKIEEKEDEILEQMMEVDEKERLLQDASKDLGEKQEEVEARRRELEEFLKSSESELHAVQDQVEAVKDALGRQYLAQYARIAAVRNGMALAPVVGGTCQGCHVRLRPQLLAEVKLNRQIKVCENCSRILYFPTS